MADNSYSWWKLTFLRKKKSTPKVLYEIPADYSNNDKQEMAQTAGATRPEPPTDSEFNARLEKIVDKNTKGKHVKVSNSGRFKEKKKVRATLAENPALFGEGGDSGGGDQ